MTPTELERAIAERLALEVGVDDIDSPPWVLGIEDWPKLAREAMAMMERVARQWQHGPLDLSPALDPPAKEEP